MKIRLFVILIIVALLFAACGGNNTTETQGTKEPTNTPGSNETTVPQDIDDIGIITYTTPDGDWVIELPEDEFGDDVEGILSSRPIGSDVPDATEPVITDPPVTENPNSNLGPNETPEDVFE